MRQRPAKGFEGFDFFAIVLLLVDLQRLRPFRDVWNQAIPQRFLLNFPLQEASVHKEAVHLDHPDHRVLFDPAFTVISPSFAIRPGEVEWQSVDHTWTLREMEAIKVKHRLALPGAPVDPAKLLCKVEHPGITASGRKAATEVHTGIVPGAQYVEDAGKHYVRVDIPTLAKRLRAEGVKGPWSVRVSVDYPVAARG